MSLEQRKKLNARLKMCVYLSMYTHVHMHACACTHVHRHGYSGERAQVNYLKTTVQRKDMSCASLECKDTGMTKTDLNGTSSSGKLEDLVRAFRPAHKWNGIPNAI